jgi:hypothetical protein
VTGTPADTAAAIDAIAREVQRLTPSWERPETFHEQKAEIIGALRALARSPLVTRRVVRFIPVPAPAPLPPPPNPAVPSGGSVRLVLQNRLRAGGHGMRVMSDVTNPFVEGARHDQG